MSLTNIDAAKCWNKDTAECLYFLAVAGSLTASKVNMTASLEIIL